MSYNSKYKGTEVESLLDKVDDMGEIPTKVSQLENDAGYLTSHQDISHLATKTELEKKQDEISDLDEIRTKAKSALQKVPAEYVTESELEGKGYATENQVAEVKKDVNQYTDEKVAALVNGAPETLNTLDELAAALKDNKDIVDVLNASIGNKQDKIEDLETIRQGAAKGATALQSSGGAIRGDLIIGSGDTNTWIHYFKKDINAKFGAIGVSSSHEPLFDDITTVHTIIHSGNIGSQSVNYATSATKATQDGNGKVIADTYAVKITTVKHGTSDTTFTLTPNVFHKWGEVSNLSLSLEEYTGEDIVYYMAEFVSGSTATTLSVPDNIKWESDVTIEAGKTYQISILNNCGIIGGF